MISMKHDLMTFWSPSVAVLQGTTYPAWGFWVVLASPSILRHGSGTTRRWVRVGVLWSTPSGRLRRWGSLWIIPTLRTKYQENLSSEIVGDAILIILFSGFPPSFFRFTNQMYSLSIVKAHPLSICIKSEYHRTVYSLNKTCLYSCFQTLLMPIMINFDYNYIQD